MEKKGKQNSPDNDRGYVLVKKQEIYLSLEDAIRWRDTQVYKRFPDERDLRAAIAQRYIRSVKEDSFLWELVILVECWLEGKLYALNGQHVCKVREAAAALLTTNPVVTKLTYRADSLEAMRRLYAVIDRNLPRTSGHIFNVLLGGSAAVEGISGSVWGPGSGFMLWKYGFRKNLKADVSIDRACEEIMEQPALTQLFNRTTRFIKQHTGGDAGECFRKKGVMGACFYTAKEAPATSVDFWYTVFTDEAGKDEQDPRRCLHRFLISRTRPCNGKDRDGLTAESIYRICQKAWQCFREGGKLTMAELKIVPAHRLEDPNYGEDEGGLTAAA